MSHWNRQIINSIWFNKYCFACNATVVCRQWLASLRSTSHGEWKSAASMNYCYRPKNRNWFPIGQVYYSIKFIIYVSDHISIQWLYQITDQTAVMMMIDWEIPNTHTYTHTLSSRMRITQMISHLFTPYRFDVVISVDALAIQASWKRLMANGDIICYLCSNSCTHS